MDIYELLKTKPEFELVNEFNLSARLLKEFDEDLTIVFDSSTWRYKIISIRNFIATGLYEVYTVPKNMVNDAIIYFLKSFDNRIMRSKYITRYYETENIYKNFKRKQKSEVKKHFKRIRMNMGEML